MAGHSKWANIKHRKGAQDAKRSKIFAKLGRDYKKPDATTCITRETYQNIVWPLPARDMMGVGKTTAAAKLGKKPTLEIVEEEKH